ncbi:MAG: 5-(carboxyamino)imidazole ribonucleotide synthase [Anaerolineales bacterium]|nr:5-(carboxyamino)imidazole ribonucleotide synthase [Anaerolineales bacterium]
MTPFPTIGILGGGQLGWMLGFAAKRIGFTLAILDPDPNCPASQIADRLVVGSFRDPAAIRDLAAGCDVITVEIEHVDTETLAALEASGVSVQPSAGTIRLIQDKYLQKTHLAAAGVPLPPFRMVASDTDLEAACESFGVPLMLKTRRLAYDGRGNAVIETQAELEKVVETLGGYDQGLYVEGWIPFERELAVMVVRTLDGSLQTFPVVETIHRRNICHVVIAPAPISTILQREAERVARLAVGAFGGAGIFGVEMFLTEAGRVLVNEVAPRPHNSGHYTLEACHTSQFEAHLRAITEQPLGAAGLKVGAAAMVNLLGAAVPEATLTLLEAARNIPGAALYWYGKALRANRKVGHVTLTGGDYSEIAAPLEHLSGVTITPPPQVGIIMGSDSDLPTMREAALILRDFGIHFEINIVSAHRTPERMVAYAKTAHERGLKVIIAGAGGAAHLPGMVAALTPLPVIGVPVAIGHLNGQDALLSIVQMPKGIPVATVAIGNAANAGLLAVRLLAAANPSLLEKMIAYQQGLAEMVMAKADTLTAQGWDHPFQ